MSRGLGREQTRILRAVATDPSRWWSRMEIQQAAWGAQVRTGRLKRDPKHGRRQEGRRIGVEDAPLLAQELSTDPSLP
jgi:hypothetical protein